MREGAGRWASWLAVGVVAAVAASCPSARGEVGEGPPLVWQRHGETVLEINWRRGEREAGPAPPAPPAVRVHFRRWGSGERLGTMTLHHPWVDARGQPIEPGAYVLRYAVQPISKDHVGTAPGRDFLVLVPAARDPAAKVVPEAELWELGRQASASSHPAVIEIRRPGSVPAEGGIVLATRIGREDMLLVVESPVRSSGLF